MNKTTLKNIVIIVAVSSLIGIVYNTFSASGIPLIREEQKVTYLSDEDLLESHGSFDEGLRAINVEQAYKQYQLGIQFIDARDNWDFADGHIEGAINLPEFSFNPESDLLKTLNKEYRYIIYCDGDDCDTSKRLAFELIKLGFKDLLIFVDGIEVWKDHNYPVEVPEND